MVVFPAAALVGGGVDAAGFGAAAHPAAIGASNSHPYHCHEWTMATTPGRRLGVVTFGFRRANSQIGKNVIYGIDLRLYRGNNLKLLNRRAIEPVTLARSLS